MRAKKIERELQAELAANQISNPQEAETLNQKFHDFRRAASQNKGFDVRSGKSFLDFSNELQKIDERIQKDTGLYSLAKEFAGHVKEMLELQKTTDAASEFIEMYGQEQKEKLYRRVFGEEPIRD